jgi:hypothetical protein
MYNSGVKKPVIRLSEAEAAASDVATLLARVRGGTEIIIEIEKRPIAIFRAVEPAPRTIFECIALLPEDSTATIDSDFSKDVKVAVESQLEPLNPPAWD